MLSLDQSSVKELLLWIETLSLVVFSSFVSNTNQQRVPADLKAFNHRGESQQNTKRGMQTEIEFIKASTLPLKITHAIDFISYAD